MNLRQLAQQRAEALARWEALQQLGVPWNPHSPDDKALDVARHRAKAAYMELENRYQKATSILTTGELAAIEKEASNASPLPGMRG